MRTDKHIFQVFRMLPSQLVQLLDLPLTSGCQYLSMVVKAIQRECDGVLVFDDPSLGVYFVEWQFYYDPEIDNRLTIAMASLQCEFPGRRIHGIIVFAHEDLDPKTEPLKAKSLEELNNLRSVLKMRLAK